MHRVTEYRGYRVDAEGRMFVARPLDPEEAPIEIVGKSVARVFVRIDELWLILDNPSMMKPKWVLEWLSGHKVRLTPDTDAIIDSLLDTFDITVKDTDADMATYTVDHLGRGRRRHPDWRKRQ